MPNRYIREGIIESESVNSLPWHAEVFYRRLINRVDDFGRFTATPALLRAKLFPLQLDKVSEGDTVRLLKQCEDAGLVFTYSENQRSYLVVNKWEKGRAMHSEYPNPPAEIDDRMKAFVYIGKHPQTKVSDSDSDSSSDSDTGLRYPASAGKGFKVRFKEWIKARRGLGKKPKNWTAMFQEQLDWLAQYPEAIAIEILSQSIRNGWQGLFPPKGTNGAGSGGAAAVAQGRHHGLSEEEMPEVAEI